MQDKQGMTTHHLDRHFVLAFFCTHVLVLPQLTCVNSESSPPCGNHLLWIATSLVSFSCLRLLDHAPANVGNLGQSDPRLRVLECLVRHGHGGSAAHGDFECVRST